ncbi:MAG: cupin domain-containing protein [Bryobacterales bacterium]|nr:cupin domain-containing protein [Bryobacterales bacterium]
MNGGGPPYDLHEQAGLYALGLLPAPEATEFAAGLSAGRDSYRQALREMTEVIATAVLAGAAPAAPGSVLKARVLAGVAKHPYPGLYAKRAHEQGPWRPTGSPGVTFKKLFHDKEAGLVTLLVKMEPGSRYDAHSHGRTEQCLILAGDVRYSGDTIYREGDFTWAEAGSTDPALYTVEGNLLLIISAAG